MKFLYLCLTYLYAVPVTVAALIVRVFGDRDQLERAGLNLPYRDVAEGSVWFVASSVGEVNIALKIIERLKAGTSKPVILSVTTRTGRRHAIDSGCKADIICYHPLDVSCIVGRFLRAFKPSIIVLIETELWPVLMEQALERKIKVMQVSGRLSARSLKRYLPFKPLFSPLLQRCERLMMQSVEDAARILQLSDHAGNIEVTGSAKTEYVPPPSDRLQQVKDYLLPWTGNPVFTCGSTRPGEEIILLEAFAKFSSSSPDLRLALAPRHLDRVDEVVTSIGRLSLTLCRRSQSPIHKETQVLLLDTIGELNLFYHCSDIAFVGGTLAPFGGHNLLEPALAGCPVLFGPHFENQKISEELLIRHNMGFLVNNCDDVCEKIADILADPEARKDFMSSAESLRRENPSIVDIYVATIRDLL